ncbi:MULTISPECIES: putative phage tail assembly chaperone [Shewanella]|uniref:Phage protein n=1 Tax=Shewanella baltica (strain OS155 / ATCC BAA-1091) TaxID=325240 RepID=A3D251_SHEB5|nr:putative phage tail assembly chaperone [Shewanella baltica]ABN60814.1 conserved hypothetical protein [Shewanella baltica OS155]AEH13164.1 hypothetical protein Sbal117_1402 [Shewanella baltica OS117]
MKKTIVLTIAGTDFSFNVTVADHNDLFDTVSRGGSMTAGSHNFVMRSIDPSQKEEFKKLIDESPGAAVNIATILKTEFSPVLDIAVKK